MEEGFSDTDERLKDCASPMLNLYRNAAAVERLRATHLK